MTDDATREAEYKEVKAYLTSHFPDAEIIHSTEGMEFSRDMVAFRVKRGADTTGVSILHDVLDDAFQAGLRNEAKRAGVRSLLERLRLAARLQLTGSSWLLVQYGSGGGITISPDPVHDRRPLSEQAKTFGQRLEQLRRERKMTLAELAAAANISNTQLSLYETGDALPDDETLERIAQALGL